MDDSSRTPAGTATARRSARNLPADLPTNIERESGQSCPSEVQDNLPEGDYELEVDALAVDGDTGDGCGTDQDDNSSASTSTVDDAGIVRAAHAPASSVQARRGA